MWNYTKEGRKVENFCLIPLWFQKSKRTSNEKDFFDFIRVEMKFLITIKNHDNRIQFIHLPYE